MAKRYYLSPVIERESPLGFGTEYLPKIKVDHPTVSSVQVIPLDPETGRPRFPWCLVLVAARDHGPLQRDTALGHLPDFPLDGKVSAINVLARTRMNQALEKFGIDTAFIQGTDGYRDVIRTVGQLLTPAFHEDAFDVSE